MKIEGEEERGADWLMERPAPWRAPSLGRELGRKLHHLGPGLWTLDYGEKTRVVFQLE